MSKAILLSIKPEWLVKILNGEKTIEIRKKFPKDYVGWVYLYCSKDIRNGLYWADKWVCVNQKNCIPSIRNGKVVARFWCDRVESIRIMKNKSNCYMVMNLSGYELRKTCLTAEQLYNYLKYKDGCAIHISKLEIVDKPKELSEFRVKDKYIEWHYSPDGIGEEVHFEGTKPLKKAPQNYCYVEVE